MVPTSSSSALVNALFCVQYCGLRFLSLFASLSHEVQREPIVKTLLEPESDSERTDVLLVVLVPLDNENLRCMRGRIVGNSKCY